MGAPDGTERTLFGLVNDGADFFSRLEEAGKPEQTEKQGSFLNSAALMAAEKPDTLAKLLMPIDWDAAYGRKDGGE